MIACPECHGTLWKIAEGRILRFRCRTGHAYTAQSLLEELTENVEATLWMAIRSLEEKASLMQQIAWRLGEHGDESAGRYRASAQEVQERARLLRGALGNDRRRGSAG